LRKLQILSDVRESTALTNATKGVPELETKASGFPKSIFHAAFISISWPILLLSRLEKQLVSELGFILVTFLMSLPPKPVMESTFFQHPQTWLCNKALL
jgi:hypothetical protein